ncbi:MAG TPA: MFS transporter [Candidatus Eisenbacteria bacterium]
MEVRERPPLLLLQRNFSALWWGQLISLLGDRLTYLALGGLLLEHTHRGADPEYPVLLALLGNVMAAPVLLFSPFTGAWVDRMNLKRVLIISDLGRAAIVLAVPWAYALTHHTGTAFALVFALFTCNVFFLPAKSAITPEIVPPDQLLAANSLLSVAGITATAVGALGGGWVVDHWGWPVAMRIDALTYLVSVGTIAGIRYRASERRPVVPAETPHRYLREVQEGWSVVRHNPHVGLGLTALAAVWIGGGFLHVAGNQHIQQVASVPGMERVGVLLFVLGLGAALGTWWINSRGRRWPRPLSLGGGMILAGLALIAFAVTRRFAVFAISAFLVGAFAAPAFVLTETLIQEGTELQQRGRIFSLRDFLMRSAFMISVALAGSLSGIFGPQVTILVTAGCLFAVGALSLHWGRRHPALMEVQPPR